MSRYPNRIPNRTPQAPKKEEKSALDYFKDTWNRTSAPRKVTTTCEDYIRNMSVRNRDYTTPTYRNTANTFSTIVRNEDLKEVRLIGEYSVTDFPIEANNRVEFFYAPSGKKVDYKEITKVEEIQASEYSSDPTNHLKNIGFTKFYQLYKKNDFGVEVKLCRMATR